MMAVKSATARGILAVVAVIGSSFLVEGAPTGEQENNINHIILEKRKPILSDSDQITIDHTVPLDAILLVGAGLVAALLCFCLALWNIYAPNASGSRRIREERAQAKTELRLKGAGGGGGGSNNSSRGTISPTRNMTEKKRGRHSQGTTTTDFLSVDSHTKLVPHSSANTSVRLGPRVAPHAGRSSRASRGYSSYSKHDVQSLSKANRIDSVTMLAVPTLPQHNNADSSSSRSISSGSANGGVIPSAPWHARPSGLQDRAHSYNSQHNRRISDSVGRGIDLNRNRSLKNYSNRIHVTPQAVDPTYSNQRRVSPQGSSSDLQDPLSGYELKRFTTDPTEQRDGLPKNVSMNALDFFGYNSGGSPIYANRHYIADNGSDSASHENLESPSTPLGLPRSKVTAFYDAEEGVYSPSARQESYPLNQYNSRYGPASPTRKDRKVWGNRF